jgi:vesicle coat complex subunit
MELENVQTIENLSSNDDQKKITALITLLQQANSGYDVQSFLETIIQVKKKN